jgi:hypothetical protein
MEAVVRGQPAFPHDDPLQNDLNGGFVPKIKLAICIPSYGNPEALFMQSLLNAIEHWNRAKLTDENGEEYEKVVETFIIQSSMLTESRHMLVGEAINCGADYMLWCDADHIFEADSICRLWARNVDVVGCNYARRGKPTAPVAAKVVVEQDAENDHKNLVYTDAGKAADNLLEEVDHMGFGLCLIRMSIFDRLQLHAESKGEKSFLPLFVFKPKEDGSGMIGEDVYFFGKIREAGIKVWCDHGVSWTVGHITNIVLTNAHAVTQRDAWNDQRVKLNERYTKRADELESAD